MFEFDCAGERSYGLIMTIFIDYKHAFAVINSLLKKFKKVVLHSIESCDGTVCFIPQ